MVKHNNVLPNAHFRKEWDMRVKTWLDQPARKQRRRQARQAKAVKISPRPVAGALRPVVRCPTQKYNMKLRAGRGFTLEEIKAAGLTKAKATSIGIAVDHRRSNKSTESLAANTDRLKLYLSKLVLPTRPKGSAKGVKADFSAVEATAQLKGQVLPVPRNLPSLTYGSVSQTLAAAPGGLKAADGSALYKSNFEALRKERANARLVGIREKKAKEAAAKDAAAAKKAGKAGDAEEA